MYAYSFWMQGNKVYSRWTASSEGKCSRHVGSSTYMVMVSSPEGQDWNLAGSYPRTNPAPFSPSNCLACLWPWVLGQILDLIRKPRTTQEHQSQGRKKDGGLDYVWMAILCTKELSTNSPHSMTTYSPDVGGSRGSLDINCQAMTRNNSKGRMGVPVSNTFLGGWHVE